VDVVHRRSELLPLQNTIDKAFDPYAFIRNAYLQRREYQIKDGNVPEDVGESWSVEPPQR
jgi:phospholipid-binding lipoprotein MlaA